MADANDLSAAAAALRRLARRDDIKHFVLSNAPVHSALQAAAQRYVVGDSIADALRALDALRARGHAVTIDFLGEDTRDERAARSATDEFLALIARLDARDSISAKASVSLDLSHIGLAISEELALDHARQIAAAADNAGREMMISMESSSRTDAILRIHETLCHRYGSVGITLQAALKRTPQDLSAVLQRPGRIRLVKGAYAESDKVAFPRGELVDRAYDDLLANLIESGHPCSIATHDSRLIERAQALLQDGADGGTMEFEMLYGVTPERLDQVRSKGRFTRVYIVYGNEWYLYLCHRLAEQPTAVLRALADIGMRL
jgi:proline dehydrogenase